MDLNDLRDAEQYQKHFVLPIVEAVRKEVAGLVKRDEEQEERIKALEDNQTKALAGFAAAAAGVSLVMGFVFDWCRKKMGL